jgi:lipid-A-disaccharide synthase
MPSPITKFPTTKQKTSKQQNVVIVAGEASGDAHGARLVNELKKLDNSIQFRGMGGDSLRAAGVDVFIDMSDISVVGFLEVLLKYNLIKAELNKLKNNIKRQPPDLLILIDYQEFNQRLAAYAKSIGIKVLFYIGPQVWAWRPKRVHKMAKIVDHLAVIMPFEKALYAEADVAVTFTGHPLSDEVIIDKTPQQARTSIGLKELTTVGLFPGSRSSEIAHMLPVLLESAKIIKQQRAKNHQAKVQFVLPLASTISSEDMATYQAEMADLSVSTIQDQFYDVIQACDAIITSSGTATLEIGLLETPMVIIYKTSALTFFIAKRLVKLKHIGLVNIIRGKEVVKELLQHQAKPALIAEETLQLLNNRAYIQTMQHELSLLRPQLGSGNGARNIAKLAWDMLSGRV